MKYKVRDTFYLGQKVPQRGPIRVIGAGISGLLTGFFLRQKGYDFEIIERSERAGGLLGTRSLEKGLAEQAANGFLWSPELQALTDALQLPLLRPQPSAKKRFLVRKGQLRRFPLGLGESLSLISRLLRPHRQALQTATDFGNVYFGSAFSQQILTPGLAGIYGANADQLSFPGALGRVASILNHSDWFPLALWRQRRQNAASASQGAKKASGTHSFAGGMADLINALQEHLKDHLRYGVDGLDYREAKEHQIICTPAHVSQHFFEGELKQLLGQVHYTPLLSTTVLVARKDLPGFKEGFGCLIPRNEGIHSLGVLFNSCIFPHRSREEGLLSMTCILRQDEHHPNLLAQTDEEIQGLIRRDFEQLFGFKDQFEEQAIFRWPQAIPIYSPELYEAWPEIDRLLREQYPLRQLFGNYTGQISIRGMCEAATKEIGGQ